MNAALTIRETILAAVGKGARTQSAIMAATSLDGGQVSSNLSHLKRSGDVVATNDGLTLGRGKVMPCKTVYDSKRDGALPPELVKELRTDAREDSAVAARAIAAKVAPPPVMKIDPASKDHMPASFEDYVAKLPPPPKAPAITPTVESKPKAPAGANGATHKLPEAQPEPARVAVAEPVPVPVIKSSASGILTNCTEPLIPTPAAAAPAAPEPQAVSDTGNQYDRAAELIDDWVNVFADEAITGEEQAKEDEREARRLSQWLRSMRSVHPAFTGLLGALPPAGTRIPEKKLFALTTAITAMLEFFYGAG